jgi:hypothetical protein
MDKVNYSRSKIVGVFFAPARYMVVKIARFSSEVVLQTIKHMMIYPSLDPSLKIIALHIAV